MGRCRIVAPEEVRLPLSDGDYVDVKKLLNAGEYRKLLYDQFKDGEGESIKIDHAKIGIAKLLAYILGWNFVGLNQAPLPYTPDQPEEIRRATLDALDPDTYRELIAAINAHEAEQERVLEAKKKGPGIVTMS